MCARIYACVCLCTSSCAYTHVEMKKNLVARVEGVWTGGILLRRNIDLHTYNVHRYEKTWRSGGGVRTVVAACKDDWR